MKELEETYSKYVRQVFGYLMTLTEDFNLEHRRKGLAVACAASLILECLKRSIYPKWEAANMDSVAGISLR